MRAEREHVKCPLEGCDLSFRPGSIGNLAYGGYCTWEHRELSSLRRVLAMSERLDDALAEFGTLNPAFIAEAVQHFHDELARHRREFPHE